MDFKGNALKFGSLTAFRGSHTNAILGTTGVPLSFTTKCVHKLQLPTAIEGPREG